MRTVAINKRPRITPETKPRPGYGPMTNEKRDPEKATPCKSWSEG